MAFRPYRSSRLAPRKKARRNEQAHSYDEGDYLYDETPRCRMGTFSPVARHAIINAAYQAQEFQHARYLENLRASILKLGSNDDISRGLSAEDSSKADGTSQSFMPFASLRCSPGSGFPTGFSEGGRDAEQKALPSFCIYLYDLLVGSPCTDGSSMLIDEVPTTADACGSCVPAQKGEIDTGMIARDVSTSPCTKTPAPSCVEDGKPEAQPIDGIGIEMLHTSAPSAEKGLSVHRAHWCSSLWQEWYLTYDAKSYMRSSDLEQELPMPKASLVPMKSSAATSLLQLPFSRRATLFAAAMAFCGLRVRRLPSALMSSIDQSTNGVIYLMTARGG